MLNQVDFITFIRFVTNGLWRIRDPLDYFIVKRCFKCLVKQVCRIGCYENEFWTFNELKRKNEILCRFNAIYLALFWLIGLICGVCYAACNQSVVVLMRLAIFYQVSIVGLVYVLYLPIIAAVLCVKRSCPVAFYTVASLTSFLFGCSLCWITYVYGTASWLIKVLLLFSESAVNILILYMGYQKSSARFETVREYCHLIIAALLLGCLDCLLVSPFAATLLN